MYYHLHKDANNVSIAEACPIAAIPKGPAIYYPISNYENNRKRKELIINELYKDNKISLEQKNNALHENINIKSNVSSINKI